MFNIEIIFGLEKSIVSSLFDIKTFIFNPLFEKLKIKEYAFFDQKFFWPFMCKTKQNKTKTRKISQNFETGKFFILWIKFYHTKVTVTVTVTDGNGSGYGNANGTSNDR